MTVAVTVWVEVSETWAVSVAVIVYVLYWDSVKVVLSITTVVIKVRTVTLAVAVPFIMTVSNGKVLVVVAV